MSIGENIRKYRKAEGLTQVELADKIGSAQYVITNYERGLRVPPAKKIPMIASALNVSIEDLYSSQTPEPKPRKASNSRSNQMQKVFEELTPTQQRAFLSQAKAVVKTNKE